MQQLDAIDLQLINELQTDGKQSIKELSQKINLSITPTHERIKKIEARGIIKKYVAIVNPELINKSLIVYCQITLLEHQEVAFKEFENYINCLDEVMDVSYIAGGYDFLLKVIVRDIKEYENFILKKMSQLKIISNIQSSFVIRQIKNETRISVR
ncbi:Lrp/AsnC family transcriptional regulator [Tenacibaculum finnmarkense genomovar finnmarkense]|uniref:Lrp/AsnC family transcriptional regulator n=1 Tax=Tenacibaculum finnmarkense TaxID=2781243 RepID=UPI00187B2305|nr:Lrp/AsnC family transcriptional regulator [Tenacibaculum finnmarkense]MCD8438001.1 Lrp/AsnC family transcriptional regulator [Tenacibaculum dicentrarchi]MBE7661380.1 winged helix-turn-helix transcriptional regulator [Tenacibaculum finnmarkense genomovar finnmarkense]MCD8413321.1 Lrp/AsnC family transcriptional regulator [Tenacibaculum finnmarkense genomovar ulcerans]MCD8418394.1 Lrp/AsnC family transcriptional regulator [Tenacibaculum finnmarkense genomovar finnmarkense]MCD8450179.1 Lrp/Asn